LVELAPSAFLHLGGFSSYTKRRPAASLEAGRLEAKHLPSRFFFPPVCHTNHASPPPENNQLNRLTAPFACFAFLAVEILPLGFFVSWL
jgi:hypothetical protein